MMKRRESDGETFWIIDRIEEGIAVCEDGAGGHLDISISEISGPAKEGSVLLREEGRWRSDPQAADVRRRRIYKKQRDLFQRHGKEENS